MLLRYASAPPPPALKRVTITLLILRFLLVACLAAAIYADISPSRYAAYATLFS